MNTFFRYGCILCWISLGISFPAFAQSGIQAKFLSQEISSQLYQPAYLADYEFDKFGIGASGQYRLGFNTLTLSQIFQDDNFLDSNEKAAIVNSLEDDNRFQAAIGGNFFANIRLGKIPLSISGSTRNQTFAKIDNPLTVGLLLNGNAPYAGQTLSDENITFQNYNWSEFAVGSAVELGKIQIGGRLKLLLGDRIMTVNDLSYSLTTEKNGANIDLTSQYDFFSSTNGGTGFGIDLGITFQPTEKIRFQAALLDLGTISWDGKRFNNNVDVFYEGVEIKNILDSDLSGTTAFAVTDSLRDLLVPDSTLEKVNFATPARISIAGDFRFSENNLVGISLDYGLSPESSGTPLPLVALVYQRNLGEILTLGTHVYGGGMDQWGWGAMARGRFVLPSGLHFSAYFSLDNAMGIVAGNSANGMALQGGITIGL